MGYIMHMEPLTNEANKDEYLEDENLKRVYEQLQIKK